MITIHGCSMQNRKELYESLLSFMMEPWNGAWESPKKFELLQENGTEQSFTVIIFYTISNLFVYRIMKEIE